MWARRLSKDVVASRSWPSRTATHWPRCSCQWAFIHALLGYVSRHDHALLDFRLSLPWEWTRDEQKRQACQVPPDVRYQTRQAQCLEMLDEWRDQVPHGWVTGDDELGRHTRFRQALRERGERYVLGVPCTTTMRDLEAPLPAYAGRGRPRKTPWQSVRQWRQGLDAQAWTRLTVRDGEKGPVAIEMVKRRVQTRLERKRTGPTEWLVITRRPLSDARALETPASRGACDQDTRYGYRYYLTPTQTHASELEEPSLAELARVIKAGSRIEASFKRGKGEVGMDEYQVRTWQGWHHHMALSLIAVWFLIGKTHRGQQVTPALILPQVRYGLSVLLLAVLYTPDVDYICRQVQRQLLRNEAARFYHHRTRKCLPPRSYAERYSRFMRRNVAVDPFVLCIPRRRCACPACRSMAEQPIILRLGQGQTDRPVSFCGRMRYSGHAGLDVRRCGEG
jgi:SRSO17 transposase